MPYFTSFILCSTHSPIWIITRTHWSLMQVLTTGPHGCFVHHWNACVECCLWLHPIHTMHTVPIHEVPTYAHWPISHLSMVGAPLCAHHTPFPLTFCQFSHTQALPCMFQIQSHCRIWMQCSPCHTQSEVTPLQHQPQRPFFWEAGTLIGGPPPLSSYPWQHFACMHVPTSISSQIAPHLDPPVHPCHSSTQGSLAHHWPQRSSFQLVGTPIKCPPPPPISLRHSVHAHT